MNFKFAVSTAVIAMAAASSASAASYSFSMPVAPVAPLAAFLVVSGPSFIDYFNFTAPVGAVQTSGAVVSIDLVPYANIDSLQISLYNGSNGTGSVVASGSVGEFSQLENIAITPSSAYSFMVSGLVTGAPSGYYTFTAVAAPVPEPETYALMLAGIAAVGFVAMRRRG
jgi:hypothetical protein